MRRDYDPEPIVIGIDVIVDYLERMRRPGMADFVRSFQRMERDHVAERQMWQEREKRLIEKLHEYEPPAPRQEQPDYTPPPEASD